MWGKGALRKRQIALDLPKLSILSPSLSIARGSLRFQQGLDKIYDYFRGKLPSDIYRHQYFLDAEDSPEQPSPRYHLTEELQMLFRLTRGITVQSAPVSRLDNTMTIVTNALTRQTILYNPIELDEKTIESTTKHIGDNTVQCIVVPTKQTWKDLSVWAEKYPTAAILHAGNLPQDLVSSLGPRLRELTEDTHKLLDGTVELIHVKPDTVTNEYLLYHPENKLLACTDLFHGCYSDSDVLNTWLCRVWFKLTREGNYKSNTILPLFRKQQFDKQGMEEMQKFVARVTQEYPFDTLIFSHGTPPLCEHASHFLRTQWGVPD